MDREDRTKKPAPPLAKNKIDSFLFGARIEVAIAPPLRVGLVSDEIVDNSLVDTPTREGRNE
jgi:hypothetical protein